MFKTYIAIFLVIVFGVSIAVAQVGSGGVSKLLQNVSLYTLLSGENQTLNEIYISDSGIPVRYTTTGDKNVKASAGELVGVMSSTGTSVTVVIYDDADGVCSSGQVTGTISLTNGAFLKLPYRFSTGICVTVGGTSPDLTVVYK